MYFSINSIRKILKNKFYLKKEKLQPINIYYYLLVVIVLII